MSFKLDIKMTLHAESGPHNIGGGVGGGGKVLLLSCHSINSQVLMATC